ncbi:hypothetical protein AURDEDRAFT_177434 [Auricularia subglabra TFB-10046 SS5]|nr:hypothetical protein AURDEDRAFT_177434 [Auricularia subglabra TFB-10046 SS5]
MVEDMEVLGSADLAPGFSGIARRITSISLSGTEEALGSLFYLFPDGRFVNAQSLSLSLTEGSLSGLQLERTLALPALTRIDLEAIDDDDEVDVTVDEVLYLVHAVLDISKDRKLALWLTDVCLCGDTKLLSGRFELEDDSPSPDSD